MENILTAISFPGLGINSIDPPQSFTLFGRSIYLYGVIIAVGLLLAVWYGLKRSKHYGLKEDDILDGVLCIVPFAILCARLYYCIFEWDRYKADPLSILYIWEGGLAIYGGVIGAAIGVTVFSKVKKVSLPAVLDLVAVSFLIGQFIGRWGNFTNREAFGAYCDNLFAMRISESFLVIPVDASEAFLEQVALLKQKAIEGGYEGFIQVHPTFLYESLWNLAGFVLLHFLSKKRRYDGQMALGYVAWYGAGRALIEGLRMDSLYWGPFRVSQMLAAISCLIAVALLLYNWFRYHDPKNLFVNKVAALEAESEEANKAGDEDTEEPTENTEAAEVSAQEAAEDQPAEAEDCAADENEAGQTAPDAGN